MMRRTPDYEEVAPVLQRLCGSVPVEATPITEGSYSAAGRWLCRWAHGMTAFVKAGASSTEDHGTLNELIAYRGILGSFIPRLIAADTGSEDQPPVLVIEDLSRAAWGIPIHPRESGALRDAIDEMEGLEPPEGAQRVGLPPKWQLLSARAERLASSGLASVEWIERVGPMLAEAESTISVEGDRIVKLDLWMQNWCRAQRGIILVDWAMWGTGNIMMTRAWAEAGVRAAGGIPGSVLVDEPAWAAWMAGQAAWFLISHTEAPPPRLNQTERREAASTLEWACDELEIEPPVHAPGFLPPGPWRP